MEVKDFTDCLFIPLIIQRESPLFNEATVAMNLEGILRLTTWVEDESGLCYVPDVIRIEILFDANINDPSSYDDMKMELFSIVATKPKFLEFNDDESVPLSDAQNMNMLRSIMTCFDGTMIKLPDDLKIHDDLFDDRWSYRISMDRTLYPCVHDGAFGFECL